MANKPRTALVISGGGAKGAFAVGVVKHLYYNYRSTGWFDIIGGSSTGALISPFVALIAAPEPIGSKAFERLEYMYTHVKTSDILKKQNIFELLINKNCLNKTDPLNKLLHQEIRQEWFDWLSTPEAPDCYVVYVNYQTGQKIAVTPKDQGMTRETFLQAMLASASVPVVMESAMIDNKECYDGGVRDLLPFSNAIELGAEMIVPIFLGPEAFGSTNSLFKRMDKILLRTLDILVDESWRNDLDMAELINIGFRTKQDLFSIFSNDQLALNKIKNVFNKKEYEDLYGAEKRLIKIITGLRPDANLTHDSLTFDPVQMQSWVDLGAQKAKTIIQQSPFI
jgi:predicted acylesterase/phospholipase RssA